MTRDPSVTLVSEHLGQGEAEEDHPASSASLVTHL